ncbi:MAG: c-type cytochrome [Anaerolineales bacterium]|nr:c-type cytochrome [Anaerolineales bacterium]
MTGLLLSYLVLLAVLVLFGWLTFRAWRIQRWLFKIPALLVTGLLTLILGLVSFFAGKGLLVMARVPAPVPDITIAGTPEQIARGEYLANVACRDCHGANDGKNMPLSGGLDLMAGEGAEDFSFAGSAVTANLTPGGILADRTDGELFRAIRYGYGKYGRLGMMASLPYRELSDEDTQAIIAFLRSQEPVTTPTNGGDQLNLIGVFLFYSEAFFPLPENNDSAISAPPQGTTADYGKYVATFGECRGCHGPEMTGTEATAISPAVPNPRLFAGAVTLDEFIQTMRTGVRPNGVALADFMPWVNASRMSDADLAALYAYLTSTP